MTNGQDFTDYIEAVSAFATIEDRRREALRKAVEQSTAEREQASLQISNQQRMYQRAARDLGNTEDALIQLGSVGGFPLPSTSVPDSSADEGVPSLSVIRTTISEIDAWVEEAHPVLESLLRSRSRLARVPFTSPPPAPPPMVTAPVRRSIWPLLAIGTIAVGVIITFAILM